MATRVCPQCGSQYVASVRRCIDCDVMLIDEVGAEGEVLATVATPLGEGDQIAYELDGWGNQLRVTLSGMLDLNEIPHVWEVGALVVAAPHEEAVDELIAAVEGGEAEELDEDAPQVAFEIDGITADELAALDAELIAAHIPHAWQETGELLVPADSEDAVATLIDEVLNPVEVAETDGLATHAALDALYVAVDKLVKDPADQKLIGRYTDASSGLDGLGVPYGMSGQEWEALLAQVAELQAALLGTAPAAEPDSADDADDDGDDGDGDLDEANEDTEADAADDATDEADDGDDDDVDDEAPTPVDRAARTRELVAALRTRLLDLV